MTALIIGQLIAIVLLGVLVAGLLRSHAEILRRLHDAGLGEGTDGTPLQTIEGVAAPRRRAGRHAADIAGETPQGSPVAVSLNRGRHLVAFLSSGCSVCAEFWDAFSGEFSVPGGDGRLLIVTKGADAESPGEVARLAPSGTRVVMSSAAWADHRIPVSPYFLLVEDGAVVGEGSAATWDQVEGLLSQAVADTSTAGRLEHSETALAAAGIRPGDASLYPAGRPEADA